MIRVWWVQQIIYVMEPVINFPTPEPELKLARPSTEKWAATLAEERLRLQEDMDALREREDNLREYELRLRSLQADIELGRNSLPPHGTISPMTTRSTPSLFHRPTSRTPFNINDDPGLQAAWEKLHRAREILEAEQKNLRDDRITMQEMEVMVKRREEAVTERETRLAEREALFNVASNGGSAAPVETHAGSAVSRITRMPFDMARSVFGGRKTG